METSTLVALSCSLLLAGAARAQPPPPPGKTRLARLELIQLAATRNLDLLSKRLEARRLEVLEEAAWQAYDPSLLVNAGFRKAAAGLARQVDYSAGVLWRAPFGTAVSASVLMDQSLNPAPEAEVNAGFLSLAVTQPLLKGGWREGAALPLSEATLQKDIQREFFKNELNTFLVDVETGYWDLAMAEADLAIKTRSRDRAKQQAEDTAENIRRGILAPAEIYVVEDNVVFFELELLRADLALRLARRKLAELVRLDPDAPLEAEDPLRKPELQLPQRQAALDEGLRSNPKVLEQRLRRQLSSTRLAFASNQALPTLDLTAGLVLHGGDDSYFQAWSTLAGASRTDARVGLLFAVPLDRAPVRASVENARIDSERQGLELQSRELKVSYEIDNALTELDSSFKLLSLSGKQVELAELKLAAETDKYKNGISTLTDVVRFQRDLDNALIGFQRNIRSIHVSRAKLLASQGILYQSVGVELR
ncbi:MAG: TolC family protein [Myxococcaceae bacterium]